VHVILSARREKGEAALDNLLRSRGAPSPVVHFARTVHQCDSQAQVLLDYGPPSLHPLPSSSSLSPTPSPARSSFPTKALQRRQYVLSPYRPSHALLPPKGITASLCVERRRSRIPPIPSRVDGSQEALLLCFLLPGAHTENDNILATLSTLTASSAYCQTRLRRCQRPLPLLHLTRW
jgi:hypothetical protein